MSSNIGTGISPMGTQPYGFGTPAVAPTPGGAVNLIPTGVQLGSLALSLDPATRGQYVFDSHGRRIGMSDVSHMVILAMLTVRGSSCVQNLGQRLIEIAKVTPTVGADIRQRVEEALSDLVARGFVRIDSMVSDPRDGHPAQTRVHLTDMTTEQPIDIAV